MQSVKLTIAYDGTNYCGWQVQPNQVSIQSMIESAFEQITGARTAVTASGRTDAGVHAFGQVGSCETASSLDAETLCRALNANLPSDIRIRSVEFVSNGFHAIRDATSKRYRYLIQNAGTMDMLEQRLAWYWHDALDITAMQAAAKLLAGRHDFAAFQAAGSPRASTIRNITHFSVTTRELEMSNQVVIEVEADGFLYNMVRNLVGTLLEIGRGAQPPKWVVEVLNSKDRRRAGQTAPPQGLFLLYVRY